MVDYFPFMAPVVQHSHGRPVGEYLPRCRELSLEGREAELGLNSTQPIRAALREVKELLDARHLHDYSVGGHEWRALSAALRFHEGEELYAPVSVRISQGNEFERLKNAVRFAHGMRRTQPEDLQKLDFLQERIAQGAQFFPDEARLIVDLEWQIRGRAAGTGAITEAEASLLNSFWNFREEFLAEGSDKGYSQSFRGTRAIDEVGLRWFRVDSSGHADWAPGLYGGRHGLSEITILELSSHFFRERRERRELSGNAGVEELRVLHRCEQAARMREQQRFADAADAFSALILDLKRKYPPPLFDELG